MENYNEKVNISSVETPCLRERLRIGQFMSYGYHIYDRVAKKNLMFNQTKETCELGVKLLREGKHEDFKKLKEVKSQETYTTNNILVERGKHGYSYYSVSTLDDFYKVVVHVLEERLDINYIQKWDFPEIPDEIMISLELKDNKVALTTEQHKQAKEKINEIPGNHQFMIDHKEKQLKILKNYTSSLNEVLDNNIDCDLAKKAIKEKDGKVAWRILSNRSDYEYENLEIVEPITVK